MRRDHEADLGYLGAALLLVALFLPSIDARGAGSVNYFANGCAATAGLLLAIAGSGVAIATRRYWVLWLTGGAALALTVLTMARVALEAGAAIEGDASGAATVGWWMGAERAVAGVVRLEWGWPVLVLGALLVLAGAEVGRRNGAVAPRGFWDVGAAAALLVVAVVVGPRLLSGTRQAITDHESTRKQDERVIWQPHEFTRVVMEATREHARERDVLARTRIEDERLVAALDQQRVARDRSLAKVRRLSNVRRWYPAFAANLRPVLEARHGFLGSYRAGGLDAARPLCDAIEERVSRAREALPRSPDPGLEGQTERLLDLYLASAQACRGDAPAAIALAQLDSTEERIGAQLDELAGSLGSYCLRLPAGTAGFVEEPASIDACSPRDRIASLR